MKSLRFTPGYARVLKEFEMIRSQKKEAGQGRARGEPDTTRARTLNEERRRAILDILTREGRVFVHDLAPQLRTSQVTIRKDLEVLHRRGLVQRTHGGALPAQEITLATTELAERKGHHNAARHAIARAASGLAVEGQTIALNSGPITELIAHELKNRRHLTVVTHSLRIAAELARSEIKVVLTGGELRINSFALVGPLAESSLKRLSADLLFLEPGGFDAQFGLTTADMLEAQVSRLMIRIARQTVLVCDSSKLGHRCLSSIAPPSVVHRIISCGRISESELKAIKDQGVELTSLPEPESSGP